MRLKQYQKDRIISTLVAVTFKDREAAREAEEWRLALAVLKTLISESEIEAMEALPTKFFATGAYFYASVARKGQSNLFVRMRLAEDQRAPHFVSCETFVIEDAALIEEVTTFCEENAKLENDRHDFEKKTKGVVNSFSTSEKLIAAWPVVAEVMPEGYFKEPEKPSLPTTQIDALDALVQGARPFETEAVAA